MHRSRSNMLLLAFLLTGLAQSLTAQDAARNDSPKPVSTQEAGTYQDAAGNVIQAATKVLDREDSPLQNPDGLRNTIIDRMQGGGPFGGRPAPDSKAADAPPASSNDEAANNSSSAPDVQIFQLRHADASSVAAISGHLLRRERNGATLVPDKRTNSLIVRGNQSLLVKIADLIKLLDIPGPATRSGEPYSTSVRLPNIPSTPRFPISSDSEGAKLTVFPLQHADVWTVWEMMSQLFGDVLLDMVFDGRTNTLLLVADDDLTTKVADVLKLLDVPASATQATDKQSNAKQQPSAPSGDQVVSDLRAKLRYLEQRTRKLATQLRQPVPDPSTGTKLKEQLKETVRQAFETRQKLQRAELAEFARRLQGIQQSIEMREKISQQIIDRRVEELLDPSLRWDDAIDARADGRNQSLNNLADTDLQAITAALTGDDQAAALRPLITPHGMDPHTIDVIKRLASSQVVTALLKEIIRETPALLESMRGVDQSPDDPRWQERMRLVRYRLSPALNILSHFSDAKDASVIDLVVPCCPPLRDSGGDNLRPFVTWYLTQICRAAQEDPEHHRLSDEHVTALRTLFWDEVKCSPPGSLAEDFAYLGLGLLSDSQTITSLIQVQSQRPIEQSHSKIVDALSNTLSCLDPADPEALRIKAAWIESLRDLSNSDNSSEQDNAHDRRFAAAITHTLHQKKLAKTEIGSLKTLHDETRVAWLKDLLALVVAKKPDNMLNEVLAMPLSFRIDSESFGSAARRLAKQVQDSLPRDSSLKCEIRILADDLKLEGITQNQMLRKSEHQDQPLSDVLTALVQQLNGNAAGTEPTQQEQQVVWLIGPDPDDSSRQVILITTRRAAKATDQ